MTEDVNAIQTYVRRFAPKKYAQIQDPQTYFQNLAQEREELIDRLVGQLPDAPPTDEQLKNPLQFMGGSISEKSNGYTKSPNRRSSTTGFLRKWTRQGSPWTLQRTRHQSSSINDFLAP